MAGLNIPKRFRLFAQEICVELVSDLVQRDDSVGVTDMTRNLVRLQANADGVHRTAEQVQVSFLHQLVFLVFHMLGRKDISENHKLTAVLSSLLHQALTTAEGCHERCYGVPERVFLFGQRVEVVLDETMSQREDLLGAAEYRTVAIRLQPDVPGCRRTRDCVWHTYYHELLHHCFMKLGEEDLRQDEDLIDLAAHLLQQAIESGEGAHELG